MSVSLSLEDLLRSSGTQVDHRRSERCLDHGSTWFLAHNPPLITAFRLSDIVVIFISVLEKEDSLCGKETCFQSTSYSNGSSGSSSLT